MAGGVSRAGRDIFTAMELIGTKRGQIYFSLAGMEISVVWLHAEEIGIGELGEPPQLFPLSLTS